MDPYTHILCLTLTFSCQTTFISGSSEIMNCVCPFLDYMTWLHHHRGVRVLHNRHTYLHTYTYTYTVTHPSEFGFVFIFEIESHIYTSFVWIRIRIRNGNLSPNQWPCGSSAFPLLWRGSLRESCQSEWASERTCWSHGYASVEAECRWCRVVWAWLSPSAE
jgi:hypothetical protein